MVKKVRSTDKNLKSALDVFEAIKRAHIRKGYIPHSNLETPAAKKRPAKKSSEEKTEEKDKNEKGPEKLIDIAEHSHEILYKADTVFPFTLFPDTVTLDREKLTFANRIFVQVAKVTSVPIRDILSVEADIGPFFGSVHTSSRYFVTNPKSINWLWRKDALELQQLLQGYIIAQEQDIDTSELDKDQLKTLLKDLGKGDTS